MSERYPTYSEQEYYDLGLVECKVVHRECGFQIGWYLPDVITKAQRIRSKDFIRMDGTHPEPMSIPKEYCENCGKWTYINEWVRDICR